MVTKEESAHLQASRALEHIARNLAGLAPGIQQLLEDMQPLSMEEHFFLLYGITLVSKALKRKTEALHAD